MVTVLVLLVVVGILPLPVLAILVVVPLLVEY